MACWLASVLATAILIAAVVAGVARGNGDPASDVLLAQKVFYPFSAPVSPRLKQALNAEVSSAAQAQFPIKIALIGKPVDLGVVPGLFNQPQKYAEFLDQEISFGMRTPLLVVMPSGFGVQGLPGASTAAAASLTRPRGSQLDALAQAAINAVAKLAAAAGHPIKAPSTGASDGAAASNGGGAASSRGRGTDNTALIAVILAVVVVAAAGIVIAIRLRRRNRAPGAGKAEAGRPPPSSSTPKARRLPPPPPRRRSRRR
jgi:hypothetical protein